MQHNVSPLEFRQALRELQVMKGCLAEISPRTRGRASENYQSSVDQLQAVPSFRQLPSSRAAETFSAEDHSNTAAARVVAEDNATIRRLWTADVERLQREIVQLKEMQDACTKSKPMSYQLIRELEGLQLSLVQERARADKLREEKDAVRLAYARDVEFLEDMLAQATAENDRLHADQLQLKQKLLQRSNATGEALPSVSCKAIDLVRAPKSPESQQTLPEPDSELSVRSLVELDGMLPLLGDRFGGQLVAPA